MNLQASAETGLSIELNSERTETIQRAFAGLDDKERQAVNAVVIEGRSLRNVGSSLGVSAMTVQRRVKRGLKQLELKLSDLQPAD